MDPAIATGDSMGNESSPVNASFGSAAECAQQNHVSMASSWSSSSQSQFQSRADRDLREACWANSSSNCFLTFPHSDLHFDATMHADEPLAFDHLFSAASYGPLPVPPPFEEFRSEDFKFSHEDFLGLSNSNSADAFAALDSFFTPEYTESFVLAQPADEDEEPLLNQLEQRFFSEFLDNLTLDQNYSFDPQGLPPNLPVLSTLSATAHNGAITAKSIRSSAIEDLEVSESPTARKRKGGMDPRFRPSANGGKNESACYYGMTMAPMLANGNRLAEAVSRSPSHSIPYSEGVVLSASPPYSPSFANAVPAKRKPEQGLDLQGNARRRSNAGDPHETHSRDAVDSNGKPSSAATATTDLPRRLSFREVTSNSNGLSDEPVPFTPFATNVSNIRENGSVILPRSAHDEHTEIQYNHKNNSNHNDVDKNHTNTKNGKSNTLPVSPSPTVVLPPKTVPPSAISKHPPPTAASDTEQQTATTTNGPTSTSKGKKEKEKKPPKELLTEEEKRANHIASEQKRRNTIRAGFKDLTAIVPRLRDVNNSKSTILFKAVDFIHHLRQRNSTLRNIASDLEVRLKLASASGAQHRPLQTTTRHVDNSHLSHSQSHTHPHAKTSSHLLHSQLYNLHDSHRHTLNHVSTSQQSPLSPTPNSFSSA